MSKNKFVLIDEAKSELADILAYYTREAGFDIAQQFSLRFDSTVELLTMWPNAGQALDGVSDVRTTMIPKFPYRMYYRYNKDALRVVGISIYHSERDLEKLIPELQKRAK